jgi:predicted 3-demethylubiquinone-9 3-methyltransferase (glyoxalase superfamily)
MEKIVPFLWFDDQAEEAANFYVSVFSKRPGAGTSRSGTSPITARPARGRPGW